MKKYHSPKVNSIGVMKPKKAKLPFMYFLGQASVPETQDGARGSHAQKCSEKWNSMTDEEKKPFWDQYEDDMKRYQRELIIWEKAEQNSPIKSQHSSSQKSEDDLGFSQDKKVENKVSSEKEPGKFGELMKGKK